MGKDDVLFESLSNFKIATGTSTKLQKHSQQEEPNGAISLDQDSIIQFNRLPYFLFDRIDRLLVTPLGFIEVALVPSEDEASRANFCDDVSPLDETDDLSHAGVVARPAGDGASHSAVRDAGPHARTVHLAGRGDYGSSPVHIGTDSHTLHQ
jgi:hypothetical protein